MFVSEGRQMKYLGLFSGKIYEESEKSSMEE